MKRVQINILANFVGQGWVAVMGLAFLPLYVEYLGVEAFGLVGLFAVLQAWLVLIDMGLTPALGREMARFIGGARSAESIRNLLRSVEVVVAAISMIMIIATAVASDWIASSWLMVESLPIGVVANSLAIMGLVAVLRFAEGIYRSALVGLQVQVLFNVLNSIIATIRWVGALGVLAWISPTIEAFFVWQAAVSVLTILVLGKATYASIPNIKNAAVFEWSELLSIWHFALGTAALTATNFLMTQADKILLSKMLSLSEFAVYSMAAAVSGAIFFLINPVISAFLPRLNELSAKGELSELAVEFHKAAQMVTIIAGSFTIVLYFYSDLLLKVWFRGQDVGVELSILFRIMIVGNLIVAWMYILAALQSALGLLALPIKLHVAGVLFTVPLMLWIVPVHGAVGAAYVHVALHTSCFSVLLYYFFNRILVEERWVWLVSDIFVPMAAGFAVIGLFSLLRPKVNSLSGEILEVLAVLVLICTALTLASDKLRGGLLRFLSRKLFGSPWRRGA